MNERRQTVHRHPPRQSRAKLFSPHWGSFDTTTPNNSNEIRSRWLHHKSHVTYRILANEVSRCRAFGETTLQRNLHIRYLHCDDIRMGTYAGVLRCVRPRQIAFG